MLGIATIRAHWSLLVSETWAIAKGDLVGQGGTVDSHCLYSEVCIKIIFGRMEMSRDKLFHTGNNGSRDGARGEGNPYF